MADLSDLQGITDAWGKWFSESHGTSCRFTASTNYDDQSDLAAYHRYQVGVTVTKVEFDPQPQPINLPPIVVEGWYDNATDVAQQDKFIEAAKTTQSFTWAVTRGIKLGIEVSAEVGAPNVAKASTKITSEVSVSRTESNTTSNEQSWAVENPFNIPPRSSMQMQLIVNQEKYNVPFTMDLFLRGWVAVWSNDKITFGNESHWLYFWSLWDVIKDCAEHGLADVSAFSPNIDRNPIGVETLQRTDAIFQASGLFTGLQGVSYIVRARQYPLRPEAAAGRLTISKGPAAQAAVLPPPISEVVLPPGPLAGV